MAHEGMVLKVDWNPVNELLISGGEDCKYKVWDSFGHMLYSGQIYDNPISSLSWKPDGQHFIIGSYNSLRLCDKIGWSYNMQKPNIGSLLDVAWSPDGTNVVAVGATGGVLFAHVSECCLECVGFEAVVSSAKTITITNVRDESKDTLEFRDRILRVSLAYEHLIALTTNQCHIYSVNNFNTPIIVDLKDATISLIIQSQDAFLLVDWGSFLVYNYGGRLISSITNSNIRTDLVYAGCVALSCETIAAKDAEDEKVIHLFDVNSGKPVGDGKPITHSAHVISLGLNQKDSAVERRLAVLDRNKDLFLYQVRVYGRNRVVIKLGARITAFMWSETQNFLTATQHEKLIVWYYPAISLIDKELIDLTKEEKDVLEGSGKYSTLNSFHKNQITIRRPEGTVVVFSISPYPGLLNDFAAKNKWTQITQLCRSAKDPLLWACLAGLATATRRLDLAEIAYAAIDKPDKVEHIRKIREIPLKEVQNAQTLLLAGQPKEAERTLTEAGLCFSAVMLNLSYFNWERALELATKSDLATSIVITTRHNYLAKMRSQESLKSFLNYQNKQILNEDALKNAIYEEYQKETKSTT
uniref:WD_REPEATS_REGION domain-containing protein n=1 Tax=Mesocestoides corti TaxID=53468 RepID=A0A5K3FIS6_MESCO